MKKYFVLILMTGVLSCNAQLRAPKTKNPVLGFFRMKGTQPDFRFIRNSPLYTSIPYTSTSYWGGANYTSYSENGRVRTTHLFDVAGILRETRSSISLKRQGRLSYWRIQFSPQRHRPLIIYTIH